MARSNSGTVPYDMWICDIYNGGNLIAIADGKRPVCGHEKDGCCISAGEQPLKTAGLSPGHHDHQFPQSRTALPYYPAMIDHHHHQGLNLHSPAAYSYGDNVAPRSSYPDPPTDLWTCHECGSQNCNWYDLCPICNRGTRSSISRYNIHTAYSSFGFTTHVPAGSAGEGAWYCPNCGGANGPLNDYCADSDCGASRP
ncbi:hypothetical protein EJ02DRAFT_467825 [Clathrospora elynae]|uniref:RanBP2-type domain-containing protein n=1 Tax=Clathrospora elynae TaxID=706981 RepID=A0A6A5SGT0_9PLEO|nr:hypothetical protein EJ02DRAFT_467825 [Clathrospora elynae]